MPQTLKTNVGRPSVIDAEAVSKIVGALHRGLSVRAACRYAGVSYGAYYDHIRREGEFTDIFVGAESATKEKARLIIVDAIRNGDAVAARWYLERHDPEFARK